MRQFLVSVLMSVIRFRIYSVLNFSRFLNLYKTKSEENIAIHTQMRTIQWITETTFDKKNIDFVNVPCGKKGF